MGKLKYVIIRSEGFLKPIMFDSLLPHSMFQNHKVESAGFVSFWADDDGELQVQTWGRSDSLTVASALGDADIIRKALTRNY